MRQEKSILVIDDEDGIRDVLKMFLESEGFKVSGAENGKVALKMLLESNPLPSAIFLDLMMPIMNGREFLETLLRDNPEILKRVPVIVITASGDPKPLGANGIVRKPFDLDAVLETLGSVACPSLNEISL